MREASYSYVLYLASIGEDIAYLQTPSKTTYVRSSVESGIPLPSSCSQMPNGHTELIIHYQTCH